MKLLYAISGFLLYNSISCDITLETTSKITDKLFKFVDVNGDNVISEEEWTRTSALPSKLKYLNNKNMIISFISVDANQDGVVEKNEFEVYISGLLEYSKNSQLKGISNVNDIDYDKIVEGSKRIFESSYLRYCKVNVTDLNNQWDNFHYCLNYKSSKECMLDACMNLSKQEIQDSFNPKDKSVSKSIIVFTGLTLFLLITSSFFLYAASSVSLIYFQVYGVTQFLALIFALLAIANAYKLKQIS